MPWTIIPRKEAYKWNEKLKNTDAPFYQYPYYVSSEYSNTFAKAVFIIYTEDEKEIAYAAIIEIGFSLFKVGVIDSGPILLHDNVDLANIVEALKTFAKEKGYMHLQVRPPFGSLLHAILKIDNSFESKLYFPFHQKVEFDSNIYNKPEKDLLAGFKLQCRRKIVLAGRLPYKFFKVEDEKTLADIRKVFKEVTTTKGYGFLPFKIYEAIYKEGKKYNLCDFYAVYLNDALVNVALIVKDARSFYHYTSALVVKGYKANESPPAKLHFFIMQDCFYSEHKDYYNISFGGSDNLLRFKELFNPVEIERPPYYTFTIKKGLLKLLSKSSTNNAARLRRFLKTISNPFMQSFLFCIIQLHLYI
jgi:hypothetical protein